MTSQLRPVPADLSTQTLADHVAMFLSEDKMEALVKALEIADIEPDSDGNAGKSAAALRAGWYNSTGDNLHQPQVNDAAYWVELMVLADVLTAAELLDGEFVADRLDVHTEMVGIGEVRPSLAAEVVFVAAVLAQLMTLGDVTY